VEFFNAWDLNHSLTLTQLQNLPQFQSLKICLQDLFLAIVRKGCFLKIVYQESVEFAAQVRQCAEQKKAIIEDKVRHFKEIQAENMALVQNNGMEVLRAMAIQLCGYDPSINMNGSLSQLTINDAATIVAVHTFPQTLNNVPQSTLDNICFCLISAHVTLTSAHIENITCSSALGQKRAVSAAFTVTMGNSGIIKASFFIFAVTMLFQYLF